MVSNRGLWDPFNFVVGKLAVIFSTGLCNSGKDQLKNIYVFGVEASRFNLLINWYVIVNKWTIRISWSMDGELKTWLLVGTVLPYIQGEGRACHVLAAISILISRGLLSYNVYIVFTLFLFFFVFTAVPQSDNTVAKLGRNIVQNLQRLANS